MKRSGWRTLLSMCKPPTTISNLIHLFERIGPTAATTTGSSAWSRTCNWFVLHKHPLFSEHQGGGGGRATRRLRMCRIAEDRKDVIENRKMMFPPGSILGNIWTKFLLIMHFLSSQRGVFSFTLQKVKSWPVCTWRSVLVGGRLLCQIISLK